MTRFARPTLAALVGLAASGCVSLSMFQGPEALDEGELVVGAGAATFAAPGDTVSDDSGINFLPEFSGRVGVGHNVDFGVKFAGFPPFGSLYGEVRWQAIEDPFPVTAGLGASYLGWETSEETYSFSAIYPSLAVGTNRLWVAGRGIVMSSGSTENVFLNATVWGLAAGTQLGGDRVRLLPELSAYFGGDNVVVGLGLGLQVRIGGEGDDDG